MTRDRKSTRLNSSHSQISYAVFCLKKKKHTEYHYHFNLLFFFFFFFNDTATTEIYTLSLHDALPILTFILSLHGFGSYGNWQRHYLPIMDYKDKYRLVIATPNSPTRAWSAADDERSEEHTSELQSQSNLVCRLLLEKKKTHRISLSL